MGKSERAPTITMDGQFKTTLRINMDDSPRNKKKVVVNEGGLRLTMG